MAGKLVCPSGCRMGRVEELTENERKQGYVDKVRCRDCGEVKFVSRAKPGTAKSSEVTQPPVPDPESEPVPAE